MICASVCLLVFIRILLMYLAENTSLLQPLEFGGITQPLCNNEGVNAAICEHLISKILTRFAGQYYQETEAKIV